jgi:hypothetical protein
VPCACACACACVQISSLAQLGSLTCAGTAGPTCLPACLPACRAHHSLEEFSIDELEKMLQVGRIMIWLEGLSRSVHWLPGAHWLVPCPGPPAQLSFSFLCLSSVFLPFFLAAGGR